MSSGFVTETEVAEARKRRQEEWEKVRQPDQPLEAPEVPYDNRSLFDRLQEQKMKKDLEYEEAHKLKNLIRGLDDDEVEFLNLVDNKKISAERQQLIEDRKELLEFREKVASLQEQNHDTKLQILAAQTKPKSTTANRPSQKSILAGVVRKRTASDRDESLKTLPENPVSGAQQENAKRAKQTTETKPVTVTLSKLPTEGAMKCIGILPGIGPYEDSSDSEASSIESMEPDIGIASLLSKKLKQTEQDE